MKSAVTLLFTILISLTAAQAQETEADINARIIDLTTKITARPKNDNLLFQRGYAYFSLGKTTEALADANTAVGINPKNLNALSLRAQIKGSKKDYDGAIADFTTAINTSSDVPFRTYLRRGEMYEKKGDREKAGADYAKALEISNPKSKEAADALARVGGNANTAQPQAAQVGESELEKLMREEGITISKEEEAKIKEQSALMVKGIMGDRDKTLKLLIQRGMLYIKSGKFDEALADGNEALKIDSRNADALLVRGLAKGGKKDYDGAITDFSQVIKSSPDRASAGYFRRGGIYEQKGEYSKAIADYNKSAELDPKAVDAATKARLRTEARMNAAQIGTTVGGALTQMTSEAEARNTELRKLRQYQEKFEALQKEANPFMDKLKATAANDAEGQRINRAAVLPKVQAVRNYLADSIVELMEYKSPEAKKLREQFSDIFTSVNRYVGNLY